MNLLKNIPIINGNKHRDYLREAYKYAWYHSDDDVTKVGAIIVISSLEQKAELNNILGYGANSYPLNLKPTEEQRKDKSWKYKHIIHAEKNAICEVLKKRSITEDLIMYMPWTPCKTCAEEIVRHGLKTIITHKELIEKTTERWHQSTSEAIDFLKTEDVKIYTYSGKIDNITHKFDGEYWKP